MLNYQILGFLKEKASDFLGRGWKNKINKYIDVRASLDGNFRTILLKRNNEPVKQPDGIYERPLRALVMGKQYVVSIATSEILNPPLWCEFYVIILGNEIEKEVIYELFKIGKEKAGISQWRNAGYGRFELTEFKELT